MSIDDIEPIVKYDPPTGETKTDYAAAGRAAADRLLEFLPARNHDDPGRLAYFTVPVPVHQGFMQAARSAFAERWSALAHS